MRKAEVCGEGPYPEGEEAEDHCCWLNLPLHVQFANIADVVTNLRRHSGSRSASATLAIRRSSYGAVRRFLTDRCNLAATLTDDDMDLLWGRSRAAASAEQAQRVSQALDAAEAFFLRLAGGNETAEGSSDHGPQLLPPGFENDFIGYRSSALQEYIRSSCSKLRGALAVQSLATGDLDSGTEMMKLWLNGGDAGLKSLGALINAGFKE